MEMHFDHLHMFHCGSESAPQPLYSMSQRCVDIDNYSCSRSYMYNAKTLARRKHCHTVDALVQRDKCPEKAAKASH